MTAFITQRGEARLLCGSSWTQIIPRSHRLPLTFPPEKSVVPGTKMYVSLFSLLLEDSVPWGYHSSFSEIQLATVEYALN
jgi:hypothetical protein